jgi:hypothetical protein
MGVIHAKPLLDRPLSSESGHPLVLDHAHPRDKERFAKHADGHEEIFRIRLISNY